MTTQFSLNDKSILITGGTGSFGKQYVRTILAHYRPKRVVAYSRDELKQFEMQQDFTAPQMRWFIGHYLPDAQSADDVRASPLRAKNLANLASATVFSAACDPLRDEGEAYAAAMMKAGVRVNVQRWPGQIHGFASMLGVIDAADSALTEGANALFNAFNDIGNSAETAVHHSGRSTSAGLQ